MFHLIATAHMLVFGMLGAIAGLITAPLLRTNATMALEGVSSIEDSWVVMYFTICGIGAGAVVGSVWGLLREMKVALANLALNTTKTSQ